MRQFTYYVFRQYVTMVINLTGNHHSNGTKNHAAGLCRDCVVDF